MLPILTPHLSSKDYGVYGVILAYIGAIGGLKDLGLATVLSITFYRYKNRYQFVWNRIFAVISLWAIPLGFLTAGVIYYVLPEDEQSNFWCIAFLYCIPIIFFEPTKWIGSKYFQLAQTPLPAVCINVTSALAGIISNYVTIRILKMGYMGWFVSGFVVSIFNFIPNLLILIGRIHIQLSFRFNWAWLKKYLAIGLPVLPHFYAIYILDAFDRIILKWYNVPMSEIGIYNLAYAMGGYFAIVGYALGDAAGPMYFQLFSTGTLVDERKARQLTFVMQAGVLLLAFLSALWMKEGFGLLIKNEELLKGYSMAVIILMSYTYRPIYFGPINKLQYLAKTKELWKISFVAALVNIILNFALIPFLGIWGAVLSTFCAMLFIGFRGYSLKAFKENNKVDYKPWLWFLLICGSTLFVFLLKDIHWTLKACISLSILAGLGITYKKIKTFLDF